jgi:hypothetical protein
MNRDTRRILVALRESLRLREEHWRNLDEQDDYQISTPVMTSLREVREAITEALEANPTVEEPITPEDMRPPRDVYNPQDKL